MENSKEPPYQKNPKLKIELLYDPAILLLDIDPKRKNKTKTKTDTNLKRYTPDVHCGFIYNYQGMEATTHEWINKMRLEYYLFIKRMKFCHLQEHG